MCGTTKIEHFRFQFIKDAFPYRVLQRKSPLDKWKCVGNYKTLKEAKAHPELTEDTELSDMVRKEGI